MRLAGRPVAALPDLDALAGLFTEPDRARRLVAALEADGQSTRGELMLRRAGGEEVPVAVRAEVVPARDGSLLGCILMLEDLTDSRRVEKAREHLEQSLSEAGPGRSVGAAAQESDALIGAILANASLAAMDIADGNAAPSVAPLLEEVEASTRRAAALYARIRNYTAEG